jgi:anti-sigma regulatory factor (Ser/Thr protein kinase)
MNKLVVPAEMDKLDDVIEFIDNSLKGHEYSDKALMAIEIAVEEIFVNIAKYAYAPVVGEATVETEICGDPEILAVRFIDSGVKYDPLEKEDPDTGLSVEDTPIGGLGIFMTKESMDDVIYEYKDNKNILTIKKALK